jgi:hypothetical protein
MGEALLDTETSIDDEIKELRSFKRSYEFLNTVSKQLGNEINCYVCQRDLKGKGVCFLRIDEAVQPLCYGCVSEVRTEG